MSTQEARDFRGREAMARARLALKDGNRSLCLGFLSAALALLQDDNGLTARALEHELERIRRDREIVKRHPGLKDLLESTRR